MPRPNLKHFAALLLASMSPAGADVTIVHWSDLHCGAYDFKSAFRKENVEGINALPDRTWPDKVGGGKIGPVDYVIATGDITDHGTDAEWDDKDDWIGDDYLSLRKLLKFPSLETMGNHDCHKGGAEAGIKKLHGNTYYSVDKGGVHFVAMDQYAGGSAMAATPDFKPKQLDWLEKDLQKVEKGKTPVVLFMHSPPVRSLGKHWTTIGDSVELFQKILDGHKVLILHGHWHKSMRNWLGPWPVLGAGCSMNPKYKGKAQTSTYNVIRLTPEKITCVAWDWVAKDWETDGKSFYDGGWMKRPKKDPAAPGPDPDDSTPAVDPPPEPETPPGAGDPPAPK